jgi:hypothetical protein
MMVVSTLRRGVIVASVLALGAMQACSHSSTQEGWVPFTQDELFGYLAGKTQVWVDSGGAYYAEDGTLDTLWDGVREGGTWSVTDNGALCWHVSSWGMLECEAYFHVGREVMYRYYGETGAVSERQDGNTLDILQAGDVVVDIDRELFKPEESMALVSGMTEFLGTDGAVYYAPDQSLTAVWNGVQHTGTWSIDDEGGVCWNVTAWGVEPCRYYYHTDDGLMIFYMGRDVVAERFREGDATGQF